MCTCELIFISFVLNFNYVNIFVATNMIKNYIIIDTII